MRKQKNKQNQTSVEQNVELAAHTATPVSTWPLVLSTASEAHSSRHNLLGLS